MNRTVQKAIHTASRVEYAVLRTPLTVLDEQVLARFAEHSKVRTVVGRGIDKLDAVAARLLPGVGRPGHATDEPVPVDDEPVPVDEVEQRAADLLEQQEQRPLAGELAEDEELRRVQAELKAKHAVEAEHTDGG